MRLTPLVGIFGGTFDPVHSAHLRVADEVRRFLAIDDFRLVPAGDPPHRHDTEASAGHRLAMLRLAAASWPGLTVDAREVERDGPSYMVDTLTDLRMEFPRAALVLVIGQDSANSLDAWHRWREIPGLAHLAVMSRQGQPPRYSEQLERELLPRITERVAALTEQPAGRVICVPVSPQAISATRIRKLLASGRNARELVPDSVLDYIQAHRLYR